MKAISQSFSIIFFIVCSLPALVHSDFLSAFALVAHAPGTPLDGKPVNANEQAFWIGKPTVSYCPDILPPGICPSGNQTVVTIHQNVTAPCQRYAVCGSAAMV